MKKKTHLFLSLLLYGLVLVYSLPIFAQTIHISLDGEFLTSPTPPIEKSGTVLVPLRLVSENLGAKVTYHHTTKEISIVSDDTQLNLCIGHTAATDNGAPFSLSHAPEIMNDTAMIPLRFVGERLGCDVSWNASTQTVALARLTQDIPYTSNFPIATMIIKDFGTVTLELYPNLAPQTVANFTALANAKFYDGLTFHRIIQDFMIQGGDPLGTGTGGPGYSIEGEFYANGHTQNLLSHVKGVISMARTNDPNSAGSQFFITSADSTFLDGQYAGFGRVVSGIDIIDQVAKVSTDERDMPLVPVIIESIRVAPNEYKIDSFNKMPN